MAACNFVGASFSAGTFNFGTIALNKRYAPGEVIATKQLPYDSVAAHTAFFCGAAVSTTATFLMSGTGGAGNIYPTSIGGIGIRISVWSNQAYLTAPTAPTLAPTDWTFTLSSGGAFGSGYLQVKAELVAISDSQYAGAMSYQVTGSLRKRAPARSGSPASTSPAPWSIAPVPWCRGPSPWPCRTWSPRPWPWVGLAAARRSRWI